MNPTDFDPVNELETALLAAQRDPAALHAFYEHLLQWQVAVLLDREVGPDGRWDPAINLCVMNNAAGKPVLAAFTAPQRAVIWRERLPQFPFGLIVDFGWVVRGLAPDVGIVINPGHTVGLELPPEAIARFKPLFANAPPR